MPLLGERLDAAAGLRAGRDRHRVRGKKMPVRTAAALPTCPLPWSTDETPRPAARDGLDPGAPRRAHESLGDPRDPQGHRAAGHHQLRPAACPRRAPFRSTRSPRPARRCCATTAPARCSTPPAKATARCARAVAAHAALDGGSGAGADHHRLAAGPGPGGQGADRQRLPRAGGDAHLPRRAAGLRAHGAGGGGRRERRRGRRRRRSRRPSAPVRASCTCCPTSRTPPAAR